MSCNGCRAVRNKPCCIAFKLKTGNSRHTCFFSSQDAIIFVLLQEWVGPTRADPAVGTDAEQGQHLMALTYIAQMPLRTLMTVISRQKYTSLCVDC